MSIIDKKPFINKVLESLTKEQRTTLKSLINGAGDGPVFRTILPYGQASAKLSTSDKGIKKVDLEVSITMRAQGTYRGFLVYNDTYCVLIAYSGKKNQQLTLLSLEQDPNSGLWHYEVRGCELSILELRSELDDVGDNDETIDCVKIHDFAEGTVLTDEILEQVKSGDIVKMANMEFVVNNKVNQTPRSITGKMVGVVNETSITIAELNWVKGEALEPTLVTMSGGSFDDMEVEIATSGAGTDTTYADPISGLEFKAKCEAGDYTTVGTIARIKNKNTGKKFRVILVGINHDVLAEDGETTVNTTWHHYDMPINDCKLGLPFNIIDWGSNMGRAYANAYLDGTNEAALTQYPSNRAGYPTATGLLHSLLQVWASYPMTLRNSLKLVRKMITIPRSTRSIAIEGGAESDSSQNTYVSEIIFHLSAKEAGSNSYGSEGTSYAWMNSDANRIRYYNGTARAYWLRTPLPSRSHNWMSVFDNGYINYYYTSTTCGVAPAFCI